MLIDHPYDLPAGLLGRCRVQPLPERLLMCPPEYFDVVDVKNPHMAEQVGRVDRLRARRQWDALRAEFTSCGAAIETLPPTVGCEDMVFCANQTLVGLDAADKPTCVMSKMRHSSRQRELPAFENWFAERGYRIAAAPPVELFEGSGDAIWHPGRGLIWGGYGHRSLPMAYEHVAREFDVPVIRLRLVSETFYHLDTCFCALDERTVMIDPHALEPRGVALIRGVFERVIECPPDEAARGMACNATAVGGRHVVIQRGNPVSVGQLRAAGYEVHEVDTSEFIKSGGSVFCMKMYVF